VTKEIRVLIAEDHDVVREGLKILIQADPGLVIAGEANNGQTAVRLAKKLQPDVVLMDLAMPQANGLTAARDIRIQAPAAKVLILSAYKDEDTIQKVMDAGVAGYMTKHSAADELLTAIREVGKGNAYYSPAIAKQMRARGSRPFRQGRSQTPATRLTPRELEVLCLVARGQPNKEMAFSLNVSIKTVEKHRQAAMDKLGIHDIAGLTRYAVAKGLLSPSLAPVDPAASSTTST